MLEYHNKITNFYVNYTTNFDVAALVLAIFRSFRSSCRLLWLLGSCGRNKINSTKMGQHKNSAQQDIFIKFMEQHINLARGFVKGDKVFYEQLWAELTDELNASGPPKKEVAAWRKVWTDWKLSVKQRLGHNKGEATKTGGGRFNKYVLTPYDEQVAIICGLYVSVDGVKGAKSFCAPHKENYKHSDLPTTSTAVQLSPTPMSPIPMSPILMSPSIEVMLEPSSVVTTIAITRADESTYQTPSPGERRLITPTPTTSPNVSSRKRKRHVPDIQDVIDMEEDKFTQISGNIEKIRRELKENRFYLKEMNRNLKCNNDNMKQLILLKEKELNEQIRHNNVIEKNLNQKKQ